MPKRWQTKSILAFVASKVRYSDVRSAANLTLAHTPPRLRVKISSTLSSDVAALCTPLCSEGVPAIVSLIVEDICRVLRARFCVA